MTSMRGVAVLLFLGMEAFAPAPANSQESLTANRGPAPLNGRDVKPTIQTRLETPVTIEFESVRLPDAIEKLAKQAGIRVAFSNEVSQSKKRISLKVKKTPVTSVLGMVLRGTELRYRVTGTDEIVIEQVAAGPRQTVGGITGRVLDSATGKGVNGVSVSIQGENLTEVTNSQGQFVFRDVSVGEHLVTGKLLGFRSATRTVNVEAGKTVVVQLRLAPTPTVLSGVVTTATGVQRRLEVGNDITVINVDSVMAAAPITSLTDLLEARVPGLIVQHTSGSPGAPSRVRLRGTSSLTRSSDPILIVDGVRVFAGQASVIQRGGENQGPGKNLGGIDPMATSPFDQIDPNSIATIEVFKGPSASAMYGADAGNGVIVITTKRGHGGRTHWMLAADGGQSMLPDGGYPTNFFRFGYVPEPFGRRDSYLCGRYQGCVTDSLVEYQALNNPRLSPFGRGTNGAISLTISGGNTITYSITGSASNEQGMLRLPRLERDRFTASHGFGPPDWMRQPEQLSRWGGNSSVNIGLGSSGGSVSLMMSLLRARQQEGGSWGTIASLQGGYVDTITRALTEPLVPSFYTRIINQGWTTTTGVTLQYPLQSWLPLTATAGLNLGNFDRTALTPRGYLQVGTPRYVNIDFPDSVGRYDFGQGTTMQQNLDVRTVLQVPSRGHLPGGRVPLGFNFTTQSSSSFRATAVGLPVGVTEPANFGGGIDESPPSRSRVATSTYGWYLAPTVDLHSRLFVNPGIRFDGGSASGSNAGFSPFPKLDVSWIAIDRPDAPLWGVLTMLRPRIAFGIAGVQPAPADRLRLFEPQRGLSGNGTVQEDLLAIVNLGNTRLRPERSREFEGGLEAELWNQRFTMRLTGYHKLRYDAILSVPVAPSVSPVDGGTSFSYEYMVNIGDVRNTGVEATLGVIVLDRPSARWQVNTNVHKNSNILQRLAPGVSSVDVGGDGTKLVEGYPVFGLWERPVLGYADGNGNGFIEPGEVRVADNSIFLGAQEPNYELTTSTSLSLFNGRVNLTIDVDYQSGLTQNNIGAFGFSLTSPMILGIGRFAGLANDPRMSQEMQALIAGCGKVNDGGFCTTDYGLIQTVNMLRWQSLALNVQVPGTLVRRFGVGSMAVALQGRNLALRTNYRGKDPNVNSLGAAGNQVSDNGAIPQPRVWSVRITVGN